MARDSYQAEAIKKRADVFRLWQEILADPMNYNYIPFPGISIYTQQPPTQPASPQPAPKPLADDPFVKRKRKIILE